MARNIIVMHRGDTYEFDLTIDDDFSSSNGLYEIRGDDVIYLGIMDPHQPFETALVKKRYTKEDTDDESCTHLPITINPEDTLDLIPGVYYYEVKLHMDHNDLQGGQLVHIDKIQTVIAKTKFIICD